MGLAQAQPLDVTIAGNLKCLTNQYLNNPDANVSTIRLEPHIVITLGMANNVI